MPVCAISYAFSNYKYKVVKKSRSHQLTMSKDWRSSKRSIGDQQRRKTSTTIANIGTTFCIALHWKYVMSNKMPTIRIHDSGKPTFLIWAFSRDSFSHWSNFLSSRPWWFNLYQSNSNVHHKPTHIDQEKGQFQNTKLPERIHLVVFAPRIICSELDRSRRALLIFSAASHTAPGLLRYNWWQIVGCDVPYSTTLRYMAEHYWLPPYRRAKTPKSR